MQVNIREGGEGGGADPSSGYEVQPPPEHFKN